MAKRLSREQKQEQAAIDLINQMFTIAGHEITYDDIKGRQDNWFQEWTMTVTQSEQWKKWGVEYLRKKFRISKAAAEHQMAWVNLQWGLKYNDFEK
jgi:hypothetical protein